MENGVKITICALRAGAVKTTQLAMENRPEAEESTSDVIVGHYGK